VVYLYYAGTMQARAMALMARKLAAAQALEGQFSAEGLAALADDAGSAEMELARGLAGRLDEKDLRRVWGRVAAGPAAGPKKARARPARAAARALRAR
jgi:hypothetical protein